jgi:hypothetical protein
VLVTLALLCLRRALDSQKVTPLKGVLDVGWPLAVSGNHSRIVLIGRREALHCIGGEATNYQCHAARRPEHLPSKSGLCYCRLGDPNANQRDKAWADISMNAATNMLGMHCPGVT